MDLGIISLLLSLVIIVWLTVLSYYVFKVYTHFTKLTDKVRGENLIKVLEKVLMDEKMNTEEIQNIHRNLLAMNKESESYVQKVGVVRFNPFPDTGGEQSFSLGLLDKQDNGVILTGLHTRARTRVYVKPVVAGKSKIDLSEEEEQALKLAINNKHEQHTKK